MHGRLHADGRSSGEVRRRKARREGRSSAWSTEDSIRHDGRSSGEVRRPKARREGRSSARSTEDSTRHVSGVFSHVQSSQSEVLQDGRHHTNTPEGSCGICDDLGEEVFEGELSGLRESHERVFQTLQQVFRCLFGELGALVGLPGIIPECLECLSVGCVFWGNLACGDTGESALCVVVEGAQSGTVGRRPALLGELCKTLQRLGACRDGLYEL